jgi:hypothetical protein
MVVVAIPVADEEHRRRQGRSFHLDLVRVSAAAAGYFCSLARNALFVDASAAAAVFR